MLKPQDTILNELKEQAPSLLEIGTHMPYQVPHGYFEQLSTTILERTYMEKPEAANLPAFQVPDQYFNGLALRVLQKLVKIEAEAETMYSENESITPILNTLNKEMPYSVPANYFEQFAIEIPVEKANLIPVRKMRHWLSYAAAAVFVGMMVIGSFLFSDKQTAKDFEKYQNLDVASALDQVSDSELSTYMEENHSTNIYEVTENNPLSLDNLDDKIQSTSTENLNQYLNENGFLEMKTPSSIEK